MLYRHRRPHSEPTAIGRAARALACALALSAGDPAADSAQEPPPPEPEPGAAATPAPAVPAGPLRVALYFDPALLTPSGLQDAALALARRAHELTALGAVELVLADPEPAALLAPTRDPGALASALELLADEGGAAGALTEIRYELVDLLAAGGAAGTGDAEVRRLWADEAALLGRAWGRLAGWLAVSGTGSGSGGALAVLAADGFDADPAAFYRARTGGGAPPGGAPDWSGVARAAAAGGWTVVPVALGDTAGAFAAPHAPLAALAAATGGELVTSDAGLAGALARLRSGARTAVAGSAAGIPGAEPTAGAAGDRAAAGTAPTPPAAGTAPAPPPAAGAAPLPAPTPPAAAAPAGRAIVLLPPRRTGLGRLGGAIAGAVTGRVRFETLVTRDDVARVVFSLDGAEAASDDDPPFSAVLDLGSEARPHRVRAVALAASGRELGSSEIEVNAASAAPFAVRITAVHGDPAAGAVEVEAAVSVPPGERLERVEWYFNDTAAASRTGPPFRARVATPTANPEDFLRVVATLADGAVADDAVLLAARGEVERIAVNLVEVFAVVTDRDGAPVRGLGASDFTVRLDGADLPVETFRVADEVPLLLGLLVDTSQSMWPLMPDTKKAAARFLSDTLRERDRAFLVSFDDRPRLVHPPTGDLLELLSAFGTLTAAGRTALYDAIVFALTQLEADAGRRALVLLTDGHDWGSRYGPARATEFGQALGVPVYVLVFGDLYGDRRPLTQPDLDGVTARTGGRLFYIERLEQLAEVYDRIAAELRSQYVLAVATDRPLGPGELAKVEVAVAGRGHRVRAAVGAR